MARTKRKLDFDTIDKLVGSGKKKFVRYEEGAALYSMGRQTFMRLANEAGAVYRIRRIALVNLEIVENYLETFHDPAA